MQLSKALAILLTLGALAILASPAPAHANLMLGNIQRVLQTPSAPDVQNSTSGHFSGSAGDASGMASQDSLIDLSALPQFSGRGAASLNVSSTGDESQSRFFVDFTIPSGESYTYAATGSLDTSGSGYIATRPGSPFRT